MGAWIEICILQEIALRYIVAPYMGAWIEIYIAFTVIYQLDVAPYMGAWIEISRKALHSTCYSSRTLHGCVD